MDDAHLDQLYAAPLDEFVSRRNALAADLKAAGRAEDAAAVRAVRKPSAPAWALNQLARSEPEALAELAAVGEHLTRAHEEVLEGGDPAALHRARERERSAVARMTARAETFLTEAGFAPSADRRERIADTLFAMAADADARAAVLSGRVSTEFKRVGFGAAPAPRPAAAKTGTHHAGKTGEPGPGRSGDTDPEAIARETAAQARRVRAEAEAAVARSVRARGEAETLAEAAAEAERDAERARSAANEARRAAERAAREAERAERDAHAAAARLAAVEEDAAAPDAILPSDPGA